MSTSEMPSVEQLRQNFVERVTGLIEEYRACGLTLPELQADFDATVSILPADEMTAEERDAEEEICANIEAAAQRRRTEPTEAQIAAWRQDEYRARHRLPL
jgi:hypothetical protein